MAIETSGWCKNKDERNAGNDYHVEKEMVCGKSGVTLRQREEKLQTSKHRAELDDSSVPVEKIKGLHPM